MKIETKASQEELRNRNSDRIPFADLGVVQEAVGFVVEGMYRIRHRAGEVIYPYPLSLREERRVLQLVRKVHGNLVYRIEGFTPVRLTEGMGTVISIREKRSRR